MRTAMRGVMAAMALAMGCAQEGASVEEGRASTTSAEFRVDGGDAAMRGWLTLAMDAGGFFSLRLRGTRSGEVGTEVEGVLRAERPAQPFVRNADGSADVRVSRRDDDPDPNARGAGSVTLTGADRRVFLVVDEVLHVASDRRFALTVTLRPQDPRTLAPVGEAVVLRGSGTLTAGCPAAQDDAGAGPIEVVRADGTTVPAGPSPDEMRRTLDRCRTTLAGWQ